MDLLLKVGPFLCIVVGLWLSWGDFTTWRDGPKAGIENEIRKLKSNIIDVNKEVRRGEEFKAQRDKKFDELRALTEKLASYESHIPVEGDEMPDLIKNLADLSDKTGIEIVKISPDRVRKKDFLTELPIKIKIKGNYIQIMSYLDFISKLPRIITAENITMSLPSAKELTTNISANLTLISYRLDKYQEPKDKKKPGK